MSAFVDPVDEAILNGPQPDPLDIILALIFLGLFVFLVTN